MLADSGKYCMLKGALKKKKSPRWLEIISEAASESPTTAPDSVSRLAVEVENLDFILRFELAYIWPVRFLLLLAPVPFIVFRKWV